MTTNRKENEVLHIHTRTGVGLKKNNSSTTVATTKNGALVHLAFEIAGSFHTHQISAIDSRSVRVWRAGQNRVTVFSGATEEMTPIFTAAYFLVFAETVKSEALIAHQDFYRRYIAHFITRKNVGMLPRTRHALTELQQNVALLLAVGVTDKDDIMSLVCRARTIDLTLRAVLEGDNGTHYTKPPGDENHR